jgi:hypothetical protein
MLGGTGAAATVTVTGIVIGCAPVAFRVTVALCVPVLRPAGETLRARDPFPEPVAGETESQAALSVADHVSVPPPVLLIVSVWDEEELFP